MASLPTVPALRSITQPGTALHHRLRRPLGHRLLCSRAAGGKDFYSILGVSRRASAQEIKKAYFMQAKKSHPDLNPGHEARFREVAEAYEVLKDPTSRATYDASAFRTTAGGGQQQSYQQQHQQHQQSYQQHHQQRQRPSTHPNDPNETFRRVWSELGMADIDAYVAQMQREMRQAVGAGVKGDYGPGWRFAREHRSLIIGTLIPVTLLVRSPALTAASLRLIGPVFALSRVLPLRFQWYVFSRLWIGACRYLGRNIEAALGKIEEKKAGGRGASGRKGDD
jgi:hypothetical protein